MKLWRCKYTREIIFGSEDGGRPLFGGLLPFLGFKRLSCDCFGRADHGCWPPDFLVVRFGIGWLNQGWFWSPPWRTPIVAVRRDRAE